MTIAEPFARVAPAAPAAPRPAGRHGRFRPDIEGLRAVAVLGVVLYHARVPGLQGGFVGVDMFFVVSGYLITGLIWREVQRTGRVSMAGFYGRRARRLLPAAVLAVVATAVAARQLLPPLLVPAVMKDGATSALYVGNYRFALQQTDYLHASAPPSPFQHFWSLGVEEQFYLVWPLLLLAAVLASRRLRRRTRSRPRPEAARPLAFLVVGTVSVASAFIAVELTSANQPWAFFSLPSRAWELGAGGMLALASPVVRRLQPGTAALIGWAGLLGVVGALTYISPQMPFPGTVAFWPVAATLAVLASGEALTANLASELGPGRVLAVRPARFLGRISYSWYLWHWPILTLAPYAVGHALGLRSNLVLVVASAAVAAASYRWVESPTRSAPWLTAGRWRSLTSGLTLSAAGAAFCLIVAATVPGLVGRGQAHVVTLRPDPGPRAAGAPSAPGGVAGGSVAGASASAASPAAIAARMTAAVHAEVASSSAPGPVPANVTPGVAAAMADQTPIFSDGCMDDFLDSSVRPCSFAATSSPTKVALVGDSHAASWFPAVDSAAVADHWDLITLTKAICAPLLGLPEFNPVLDRWFGECDTWRSAVMARLRAERPQVVILGIARHYQPVYRITPYDSRWLAALDRTIRAIEALGARVVVIGPVPKPTGVVPTCLSTHMSDAAACAVPLAVGFDQAGQAAEAAVTHADRAAYLDVEPWFCTSTVCPAVVGNIELWRDDNHITRTWARYLAPVMTESLDALLGIKGPAPAIGPT